jgi:hypothetical protein
MPKEIDHDSTTEIVCPYCGYEYGESYEQFEDSDTHDTTIECTICEKIFEVCREITVTYSSSKPECEDEHRFNQEDDELWTKKRKAHFVGRKIDYVDIPESRWGYYVIRTCSVCDKKVYVEITKEDYTIRYEAWKEKILKNHK